MVGPGTANRSSKARSGRVCSRRGPKKHFFRRGRPRHVLVSQPTMAGFPSRFPICHLLARGGQNLATEEGAGRRVVVLLCSCLCVRSVLYCTWYLGTYRTHAACLLVLCCALPCPRDRQPVLFASLSYAHPARARFPVVSERGLRIKRLQQTRGPGDGGALRQSAWGHAESRKQMGWYRFVPLNQSLGLGGLALTPTVRPSVCPPCIRRFPPDKSGRWPRDLSQGCDTVWPGQTRQDNTQEAQPASLPACLPVCL